MTAALWATLTASAAFGQPAGGQPRLPVGYVLDTASPSMNRTGGQKWTPPALGRTYFVHLFSSGRPQYESAVSFFPKPDPHQLERNTHWLRCVGALRGAKGAPGGGVAVYGVVDLLQWEQLTAPEPHPFRVSHPEYFEVDRYGTPGQEADEKYVSLHVPEVRSALLEMVREVGRRFPWLDGLAVRAEWCAQYLRGYSQAQRAAYLRHAALDPMDLTLSDKASEERTRLLDWCRWRQDELTEFVGEVVAAYRAEQPQDRVLAVARGDQYIVDPVRMGCAACDWLAWVRRGLVQGVLLTGRWDDPRLAGAWQVSKRLAAETGKDCVLSPVISPTCRYQRVGVKPQVEALRQQDPGLGDLIFWPEKATDWDDIEHHLGATIVQREKPRAAVPPLAGPNAQTQEAAK